MFALKQEVQGLTNLVSNIIRLIILSLLLSVNGGWRWYCASVFHLRNTSANRQLNVLMNGQRLAFDPEPVYLGVTLDRLCRSRRTCKRPPLS